MIDVLKHRWISVDTKVNLASKATGQQATNPTLYAFVWSQQCGELQTEMPEVYISPHWWCGFYALCRKLNNGTPSYPHLFVHPHGHSAQWHCSTKPPQWLYCCFSPSQKPMSVCFAFIRSLARFLCRLNYLTVYNVNRCRETSLSEVCQEPISKPRSRCSYILLML